jgi:DNA repair exonuclease SbcCD ATPase subunit
MLVRRLLRSINERLGRLEQTAQRSERKQDAMLQALHLLILSAAGARDMTKLHDDLLALARRLDSSADGAGSAADALIAAKTEGEEQLGDAFAALNSADDKLRNLQARIAAATTVSDQPANDGAAAAAAAAAAAGTGNSNVVT